MTTTSESPVGTDPSGSVRAGGIRVSLKQGSPSDGTDSGGGAVGGGSGTGSGAASRETWISTNKILNSSLCGRRMNSRNPNFDYDETKLLIALWGDPQVQKTLITTHKKHPVIAELARKMREQGYNRSTEEINTRIKNLKCFYNRIKKDMAAGIINQTTWRHYAEMDEIISRPVFGNAHRLHLLQQQKQQQQPGQQQQHQSAALGGKRKATKDDYDDDDGGEEYEYDNEEKVTLDQLHQFPVKLELMSDDDDEAAEIRAEDLLMIDAKFPEESLLGGSGGVRKPAVGSLAGGRAGMATNARGGKQTDEDEDEEEDDEDDEEDDDEGSDFDVENEFNDGLDELLLKAQTKTGPGSASAAKPSFALATTTTSKASNASGLVIETISSANGTTITATPSATSTPVPTAGKISVVPTNLLLKQPTVSSSMSTPIQIYTQPTVSLASSAMMGSVAVGKVTTAGKIGGPGGVMGGGIATSIGAPGTTGVTPMKLLLVNTVAKDGTTQQILTPASEVPSMSHLMSASSFHQTKIPLTLPSKSPIVTIPSVNVPPKGVGPSAQPAPIGTGNSVGQSAHKGGQQSAGFKSLLTQLVTIQRENLAINRERMALEKERLDFEKQFGGSFVTMVRNMSTFFAGMLQHQRKELSASDPVHVKKQEDSNSQRYEDRSSEVECVGGAPKSNRTSSEVREISSTPSPTPSSVPSSGPSNNKRPATDDANDKPSSRLPPKEPNPEVSLIPVIQSTGPVPSSSEAGSLLPKKRRMMTRNATQLSQVPAQKMTPSTTNGADDPLKMEVISDNDER